MCPNSIPEKLWAGTITVAWFTPQARGEYLRRIDIKRLIIAVNTLEIMASLSRAPVLRFYLPIPRQFEIFKRTELFK
jgi:hypothetical protein